MMYFSTGLLWTSAIVLLITGALAGSSCSQIDVPEITGNYTLTGEFVQAAQQKLYYYSASPNKSFSVTLSPIGSNKDLYSGLVSVVGKTPTTVSLYQGRSTKPGIQVETLYVTSNTTDCYVFAVYGSSEGSFSIWFKELGNGSQTTPTGIKEYEEIAPNQAVNITALNNSICYQLLGNASIGYLLQDENFELIDKFDDVDKNKIYFYEARSFKWIRITANSSEDVDLYLQDVLNSTYGRHDQSSADDGKANLEEINLSTEANERVCLMIRVAGRNAAENFKLQIESSSRFLIKTLNAVVLYVIIILACIVFLYCFVKLQARFCPGEPDEEKEAIPLNVAIELGSASVVPNQIPMPMLEGQAESGELDAEPESAGEIPPPAYSHRELNLVKGE